MRSGSALWTRECDCRIDGLQARWERGPPARSRCALGTSGRGARARGTGGPSFVSIPLENVRVIFYTLSSYLE